MLARLRPSPLLTSFAAHAALLVLLRGHALPGTEARAAQVVSVELNERVRPPEEHVTPPAPVEPMRARAVAPIAAPARPTPSAAPTATATPAAEPEGTGIEVPSAPAEQQDGLSPPAAPTTPSPPPTREPGTRFDVSGYLSTVQTRVARHRHYPELALQLGEEGTVEVLVRLAQNGSLLCSPVVTRSSGHSLLDDEALRIVARAAPFPAHTAGGERGVELRIPVHFEIAD